MHNIIALLFLIKEDVKLLPIILSSEEVAEGIAGTVAQDFSNYSQKPKTCTDSPIKQKSSTQSPK
jgi:hypothetical protein